MCMAQINLNTRMRKTGNEAFTLWTVNPSKVDVVVVITEGDQATTINGTDISNPSHSFTRQEWEALGDGHNILVRQLCERNQSGGHGWGPSGHGGGGRSNNNTECSVTAIETEDTNTAANSSLTTSKNNDHGGHHGHGFGQGAYGGSHA